MRRNNNIEADMPFLLWLPIIVMSGMISIAEDTWRSAEAHARPKRPESSPQA